MEKVSTHCRKKKEFNSIQEARNYRISILKDSSLIMTENPDWTIFEVEFEFEYISTTHTKMYKSKYINRTLKNIEMEIKRVYPNEEFEIYENGGSKNSIFIRIKCNKTLSDKFNIYNRKFSTNFKKWNEYELSLISYWKSNLR